MGQGTRSCSPIRQVQRRSRVTVRASYDDGRTWPLAKQIDDGPSGYSDLAVTADKTILCVHEDSLDWPEEKLDRWYDSLTSYDYATSRRRWCERNQHSPLQSGVAQGGLQPPRPWNPTATSRGVVGKSQISWMVKIGWECRQPDPTDRSQGLAPVQPSGSAQGDAPPGRARVPLRVGTGDVGHFVDVESGESRILGNGLHVRDVLIDSDGPTHIAVEVVNHQGISPTLSPG